MRITISFFLLILFMTACTPKGDADEVTFTLESDDLLYFGADREWGIDPGTIRV